MSVLQFVCRQSWLEGKLVFIYIISDIKVSFRKMEEILLANENITEIHTVTGNINYIVKASVEDVDKMTDLLSDLMQFGQIVTSVILGQGPVKPVIDIN